MVKVEDHPSDVDKNHGRISRRQIHGKRRKHAPLDVDKNHEIIFKKTDTWEETEACFVVKVEDHPSNVDKNHGRIFKETGTWEEAEACTSFDRESG